MVFSFPEALVRLIDWIFSWRLRPLVHFLPWEHLKTLVLLPRNPYGIRCRHMTFKHLRISLQGFCSENLLHIPLQDSQRKHDLAPNARTCLDRTAADYPVCSKKRFKKWMQNRLTQLQHSTTGSSHTRGELLDSKKKHSWTAKSLNYMKQHQPLRKWYCWFQPSHSAHLHAIFSTIFSTQPGGDFGCRTMTQTK